jgi:signal transduction histidine kinase
MLAVKLVKWIKNHIFIKSDEYEVQDLVLIHMLHITLCLIAVSAIFNPFLGLPATVIYSNFFSALLVTLIYWLVRKKKNFWLGKRLYMGFVLLMINFLWIETAGSSGPTLFYILAFIPMLTFVVNNKVLKYAYTVIGINIPALLLLEVYYPELITTYPSELQRVLDILMVCIIFIVFEIPLIIYIKNLVIGQRNEALHSEKVKTSYVTHLSHEIRTPMNAILGFAEILKQDDLEYSERKKYINIINDNGNILLNLLNNIINIEKIEKERTKVNASSFQPYNLLHRIHSSLSHMAADDVEFKVIQPHSSDLSIYTDAVLLYQIISNITFNALKFTTSGHVHISYTYKNNTIIFIVKDTGPGICQSKHETLFNHFEQADDENQFLNINGSGLGLAISKNLSEQLKGQVYFKSEKGVGTAFFIEIPVDFKTLS